MENLLLVLDEIDDMFSMLGLIWRPIVSFLTACVLFAATGFVFFIAPIPLEMTVALIAVALLSLGLLDAVMERLQVQAPLRSSRSSKH